MLRAPDGRFAVDDDLALEDAGDAEVEGLAACFVRLGGEEGVTRVASDFADEFQDAHHRAVVEGDAIVVAFAQREELRPPAVRILGGEHIGQAFVEGPAIGLVLGRDEHPRHEAELIDGRFVVEGRHELHAVTFVGLADRVGVLGPATCVGLVGEDDVGDLLRLLGREPAVGLLQETASAVVRGEQASRNEEREDQQGGAHGA